MLNRNSTAVLAHIIQSHGTAWVMPMIRPMRADANAQLHCQSQRIAVVFERAPPCI